MADILATYGFIPWVRQGMASRIAETDTLGKSAGVAEERAKLSASLALTYVQLNDTPDNNSINKDLSLVGPGDIVGISSKAIVRTEPKKGVMNYEANSLPYVEFYDEDFIWRFTPAAASKNTARETRLRPWLALVVLKEDEYAFRKVADGLSYISINPTSFDTAFHSEKDHWAFGHVHLNNKLEHTSGDPLLTEIRSELSADPDSGVCRLLCPRKLLKTTGYHAFLIPAFETGRLAGLGLPTDGVKAQAPSWVKGAMPASDKRPYDFPVYHFWNFHTAAHGDFESLAAALKPIIPDAESGKMPMDIQQPGFGLETPPEGTRIIGMEAALKSPAYEPDPWPTKGSTHAPDVQTVDSLKNLLNLSADLVDKNLVVADDNPFFNTSLGDDPMLVPPVYGVWHAMVQKLGDGSNPAWVEELNLDFRYRAAAGLGTQVIQKHQEDFMHRAWQQVDQVNEANKKIEAARLTTHVVRSLYKKHLVNGSDNKSLVITNAIQHLVRSNLGTATIAHEFVRSRVPMAVRSPGFRKVTRPNTTLARIGNHVTTQRTVRILDRSKVIDNFNREEAETRFLSAARLKRAPGAAITKLLVEQVMDTALTAYSAEPKNVAKDTLVELLDEKIMVDGNSWSKTDLIQQIEARNLTPATHEQKAKELAQAIKNSSFPLARSGDNPLIVEFPNAVFEEYFGSGVHSKNYKLVILKDETPLVESELRPITTQLDALAYKAAYVSMNDTIQLLHHVAMAPKLAQPKDLAVHLLTKIDPSVTIKRKVLSTFKIWIGNQYKEVEELKPVMAYPEFDEATYSYLLEISKQFILPNIDKLPENSITLMANNQSFIEAFMAGLNHEMARELLWREYPTDQRGSYFRQFWNIDDDIFPADADAEKDKELKLDIKKMHTWAKHLGEHNPRLKSANLVLVIRGELFKKYPNTMVYAQKAEYNATEPWKPRKLKGGISETDTKFPVFEAFISPDINLFGFDLEEEEARGIRIENPGESTAGKNPGWFMVLKERPGQIRFGLDDYTTPDGDTTVMPSDKPDTWDDLAWEHLVADKDALDTYHLNFSKNITIKHPADQPVFNSNSAEIAAILYQSPVLFARHSAEMLPEK